MMRLGRLLVAGQLAVSEVVSDWGRRRSASNGPSREWCGRVDEAGFYLRM